MNDPHDLNRFLLAQQDDYERALAEVKNGRKRTHWMWYIFPQIDGLGFSSMARRYGRDPKEQNRDGKRVWTERKSVRGTGGHHGDQLPGNHDRARRLSASS